MVSRHGNLRRAPWRMLAVPLHHCANLGVAAFAVRSNVWAAWFCSQCPCWLVLSRSRAGHACAAVLAEGAITATTAHTLRSAHLRLPNSSSHSKRICWVCGQLTVCMICGWLPAFCESIVVWRLHSCAGCWKVAGCWSLAFYWQRSARGGRLCGPNCWRASRLRVCVCVSLWLLLCLRVVCLDIFDTAA